MYFLFKKKIVYLLMSKKDSVFIDVKKRSCISYYATAYNKIIEKTKTFK